MSTVTDHRRHCGPVLSASFRTVTPMTFLEVDMVHVIAREHQRDLIEAAAERRMLRRAREAHPSRHRWFRRPDPPSAA